MDRCSIAIFVLLLSFIGYVHSKDPDLTQFGKEVKSRLSDETYKKTFTDNAKSVDQLMVAIKAAVKNLYEKLNLPYEEPYEQEIEKENKKLGLKNVDADVLFHAITSAISKVLTDMGILNSDNVSDVAQKFVKDLDDSVKSMKNNDASSTFVALTTAVASILKSEGVVSEAKVNEAVEDFVQELIAFEKGRGLN